jgi:hypothetical protein
MMREYLARICMLPPSNTGSVKLLASMNHSTTSANKLIRRRNADAYRCVDMGQFLCMLFHPLSKLAITLGQEYALAVPGRSNHYDHPCRQLPHWSQYGRSVATRPVFGPDLPQIFRTSFGKSSPSLASLTLLLLFGPLRKDIADRFFKQCLGSRRDGSEAPTAWGQL